jgi:hypothetical protein
MAITRAAHAVEALGRGRDFVGMTRQRARAYARVMQTLRDLGPSKLLPAEQDQIRAAADALLFCTSITADEPARAALTDMQTLGERLIASGRWTAESVDALEGDVWACGPGLGLVLATAA